MGGAGTPSPSNFEEEARLTPNPVMVAERIAVDPALVDRTAWRQDMAKLVPVWHPLMVVSDNIWGLFYNLWLDEVRYKEEAKS